MSDHVEGYCPSCGGHSLFLGSGGHVTCSRSDCRNPAAADEILADRETEHIVTLTDKDFTIRHPLVERLHGDLELCQLHTEIHQMAGPPRVPGRYRVYLGAIFAAHVWERL